MIDIFFKNSIKWLCDSVARSDEPTELYFESAALLGYTELYSEFQLIV